MQKDFRIILNSVFEMSLDGYAIDCIFGLTQWRNSYELYLVRTWGTKQTGFHGGHRELSCLGALFI
jgi:hypothetical protein